MPAINPSLDFRLRRIRSRRAFSLFELLIVVAMMAIIAGIAIPRLQPSVASQLEKTAQVLIDDLAYARSLAVANESSYKITFSSTKSCYALTHSGTNAALDDLPPSLFDDSPGDTASQLTDFEQLPHFGAPVKIHTVLAVSDGSDSVVVTETAVGDVEFRSLGGTTRAETTTIWLASGSRDDRLFLPITINPVTGLASAGELQGRGPVMPVSSAPAPISL